MKRTPEAALEEIAALSSERERAAMEAEREIAAYYAALLMRDRVGEAFDGVVSAVTDFGFFVELRPVFVEGLVRAEDLAGAFELDPVRHALVDRAGGRAFRVGDEVRVEVASASPARRQVTLQLEGEGLAAAGKSPRRPPGAGRGQAQPARAGRVPARREAARPGRHAQKKPGRAAATRRGKGKARSKKARRRG